MSRQKFCDGFGWEKNRLLTSHHWSCQTTFIDFNFMFQLQSFFQYLHICSALNAYEKKPNPKTTKFWESKFFTKQPHFRGKK
jgi:hypothetical protein